MLVLTLCPALSGTHSVSQEQPQELLLLGEEFFDDEWDEEMEGAAAGTTLDEVWEANAPQDRTVGVGGHTIAGETLPGRMACVRVQLVLARSRRHFGLPCVCAMSAARAGVAGWVAKQEAATLRMCHELINPFKVGRLAKKKQKRLNWVLEEFSKRRAEDDAAGGRSRDWLAAHETARDHETVTVTDAELRAQAEERESVAGGAADHGSVSGTVGAEHIPRFVPPAAGTGGFGSMLHGGGGPLQPLAVHAGRPVAGRPAALAVRAPPTAPEVTELLKHRARDELRARGGRPKRPTTADRLRRMHDAVTQDVDLKFAWRDKMKFKLDFIKELYDQSVISWQTAHSRQAKIMGEMDRTGVPTFGLGYAYNI